MIAVPGLTTRSALRENYAGIVRRQCIPPERLTVTEWAVKYRQLPSSSTSPGAYRIETVPYHRRPQDLMGDHRVSMIALAWASQTGKSTLCENAIGYRIHLRPSPILFVRPKIEDAESWAKERFDPMVRVTPVLRDRVSLARGVSTMRYKVFPGGYLFVPSAQSATELASRSSAYLYIDETDRMEVIQGEGSPIDIVQRRSAAADLGLTVFTSTPRDAETTLIWPYLEEGTYELYEIPCPHCAHMQPLVWGAKEKDTGLKWPAGKPHEARYLCRSCLTLIDEREKPELLLAGDWNATQPEKDYPSFHLNGLYSPFGKSSWGTLAREWEKSQGKPASLQVFVNTRLAEPWEEPAETVNASTLANRREPHDEGTVPNGVGLLTAGVDIQDNRIEVTVWGWGEGLESWVIASHVLAGDTSREPSTHGSVWQELDEVLVRRLRHVSGREVPIDVTMIDSGHQTTNVYTFTKPRMGRRVFACKGVGGEGIPIIGKATTAGKMRTLLFPVGVDACKTEFLRSQVHEQIPGPGYVHIPDWMSDERLQQLTNEKRINRLKAGKMQRAWVPRTAGAKVEELDCRNYARAALEYRGPRVIRRLGQMAQDLAKPPEEEPQEKQQAMMDPAPAERPVRRSGRRGGWINRF